MDEPLLRRLAPDVILTQRLCDVCAVGYDSVTAFAATLPGPPRRREPRALEPRRRVRRRPRRRRGARRGRQRPTEVVAALEARVAAVSARVAGAPRPRCVLLEWIAPPYRSGHWGPELVELAGGTDPLGRCGRGRGARRMGCRARRGARGARPRVLRLRRRRARSPTCRCCARSRAGASCPPCVATPSGRSTAPPTSAAPGPGSSTASRCSPGSCTRRCSRRASRRTPAAG